MPPAAPQRGGLFTPRNIVIALVALLFLCCCCSTLGVLVVRQLQQRATSALGGLGTLTPDESEAAAVAVDFMTRLQAGDWPGAYALCTPTLQNALGSAPELAARVTTAKVQPVTWQFTDMGSGTPLKIDGTAAYASGRSGPLHLELERVGGNFKVSGFLLQ